MARLGRAQPFRPIIARPIVSNVVAHTTTGALAADAALVSGAALHPHTTTGALAADAALVSGAALHPHTTTGALAADAALVSGAAANTPPAGEHLSTGTLAADAALVSGAALHPHTTTGALAADAALVSGTASGPVTHGATGAIVASAAAIAGIAAGPATTTLDPKLFGYPNLRIKSAESARRKRHEPVEAPAPVEAKAEPLTFSGEAGVLEQLLRPTPPDAPEPPAAEPAPVPRKPKPRKPEPTVPVFPSGGALTAQEAIVLGVASVTPVILKVQDRLAELEATMNQLKAELRKERNQRRAEEIARRLLEEA